MHVCSVRWGSGWDHASHPSRLGSGPALYSWHRPRLFALSYWSLHRGAAVGTKPGSWRTRVQDRPDTQKAISRTGVRSCLKGGLGGRGGGRTKGSRGSAPRGCRPAPNISIPTSGRGGGECVAAAVCWDRLRRSPRRRNDFPLLDPGKACRARWSDPSVSIHASDARIVIQFPPQRERARA